MKTLNAIITLIITLFSYTYQDPQVEQKLIRVQACNMLARSRLSADSAYIKQVADFVDPNASENESIQRLLSLSILSCLKKIDPIEVETLGRATEETSINPMSSDYKNLLELEKWEEIFQSNNDKLISEEIKKYSTQMAEMKAVQDFMSKYDQQQGEQGEPKENPYNKNTNNDDDDDYYNSRIKPETDLNIFGIDIKNLSSTSKLVIGLSLLIFLAVVIGYASKNAISNLPATKQKVSKKKKDKSE